MTDEFIRLLTLLCFLFIATCLFCWLFTSNWFFGPIVTIAAFIGGLTLISFLSVLVIDSDRE
jgi:hypothetical protein